MNALKKQDKKRDGPQEDPYALKHYLNAINHKKEDLMAGDDAFWEKKYPTYIVNKALSSFPECLLYANEMNKMHHLDKKLQFQFFLNSIRPKKRFSKWLRSSKIKNLEYVKEYYGYSNEKAKQALEILNDDQLEEIKTIISRGGKHGKT
ncbi:DNA polymerase [Candidatus Pacearchaeota archaeon]|nr:DNA polymerase [Candidatus Pacearchaeota archaeon]